MEGDFTLTQGAFRTFKFESLAGKVDYAGRGMNLDVRLQQTPQAWLTAKGYAPLTLLRPTPPEVAGHATPAPGEAIDIEVASSQIDLGVIQGFTSYVTNVTGVAAGEHQGDRIRLRPALRRGDRHQGRRVRGARARHRVLGAGHADRPQRRGSDHHRSSRFSTTAGSR